MLGLCVYISYRLGMLDCDWYDRLFIQNRQYFNSGLNCWIKYVSKLLFDFYRVKLFPFDSKRFELMIPPLIIPASDTIPQVFLLVRGIITIIFTR